MTHLRGLTDLRYLLVTDSTVNDGGWRTLEQLPRLEGLVLDGSNVDDTTLSHAKGLTALRYLSLSDTDVTDVGLRFIERLPHLTLLDISANGNITAAGVRELKRKRPALEIVCP